MLSGVSRFLTYLNAILYALLGGLLFALPEQMAPVFAWKVTPFMVMSIGGWCLGNAWLAWFAARRWKWSIIYPSLFYLWSFGIGQSVVVYFFRDKLFLGHPIGWLYLLALFINVVTAFSGILGVILWKPKPQSSGYYISSLQYIEVIGFVLFVGFLGIYGCTAQIGAPGTNGGIFPEIMSLFTLRSFGAFYLSLALSVVPFLFDRNLDAFLSHGFLAYGLIIFITAAAFVYIRLFDFVAKPGGLIYIGAYLVVGIVFLVSFYKHGTGY